MSRWEKAGLQDRRGRRKKDQTPRSELERAQIEIEQLKHKLYLAEMENCPVKKIGRGRKERCLSEVRQRHIYMAIKECHEEQGFPVEAACELLHVARSAYYKWGFREAGPQGCGEEHLADKIEKIHSESPDKGYRRLNDDLRS